MIRPEHHKPLPERYSCVLFDMDGTLVDSARGVTASAAEALASVGATVPGPDQLHSLGMPMAVATSKVGDQAIRLTWHFGVDHYFTDVCGASDALVRSRKDAVIAESLRRLRSRGVDTSRPVMVGDRIYDVEGAATLGMPTVFALWGYGEPHESANAIAAASSPSGLLPLLQGTMQHSTAGQ